MSSTNRPKFGFQSLHSSAKAGLMFDTMQEMQASGESPFDVARRLNTIHGEKFISHDTIHRYWVKWQKSSSYESMEDQRALWKRPKKSLSPGKQRAFEKVWECVAAFSRGHRRFSLRQAWLEMCGRSVSLGIAQEDIPSYQETHYRFYQQSPFQRLAYGKSQKEHYEALKPYVHRPPVETDGKHHSDTKISTFPAPDEKDGQITIHTQFQVDRRSGIIRCPHWSTTTPDAEFIALALLKALLPRPEIGLHKCCLPKVIHYDQISCQQSALTLPAIHEDLKRLLPRSSRIQFNPVENPRSNSPVERRIGDYEAVFVPRFTKFVTEAVKLDPTLGGISTRDHYDRMLMEWVAEYNAGYATGSKLSRIETYHTTTPKDSTSISEKTIKETILFHDRRKIRFHGYGMEYKGVFYDNPALWEYRHTLLSVASEPGCLPQTLRLYKGTKPKSRQFIGILTRSTESLELSQQKQKDYVKNYRRCNKRLKNQGEAYIRDFAKIEAAKVRDILAGAPADTVVIPDPTPIHVPVRPQHAVEVF